jgi:hypothetical protein
MATIRRELRIDRPAEDVWSVVGDAGSIHRWFPGIVGCALLDTDEGPIRRVELASGLQLDESIVTNDPIARRFQYSIVGGVFRHHLGTVDVIALDDRSCLVVYGTDATPDVMALVIGGASGQALSNLADLVGAPTGRTL